MTTGARIKALRTARGLTQKQLGDLCGMADSAIRRYESDRGNPTKKTLHKIADALNVPLSELCSDELMALLKFSDETHKLFEETRDVLGQYALALEQAHAIEVLGGKRIERIVFALDKMNDEGQQKAVERVEELTEIPKYQRTPEPPPEDG